MQRFSYPSLIPLALLLVACHCHGLSAAETREWSDATGKFKVQAALVDAEGGKVRLKKTDGTLVTIPLEKLSTADREFLQRAGVKIDAPIDAEEGPPGEVARVADPEFAKALVKSLAFSPNGKLLAVGTTRDALVVFDAQTLKRCDAATKLKVGWVSSCVFTPDGRHVLGGTESGKVLVWSVSALGKLKLLREVKLHTNKVDALCLVDDGKTVVSSAFRKSVCWWNLEDGTEIASIQGYSNPITGLNVLPGGQLFVGYSGSYLLIDLMSRKLAKEINTGLGGGSGNTNDVSPNGLLTVYSDSGGLRFFETATGKEDVKDVKYQSNEIPYAGKFTPDGTRLVFGGRGAIHVLDVVSRKRIASLPYGEESAVEHLALSPGGNLVAIAPNHPSKTLYLLRIPKK